MKKLFISLITLAVVALMPGCKQFLDVNQNLNNPTNVQGSILLTSAETNIGSSFALGTTLGNGLGTYTHQLMQYGSYNRYGLDGSSMDGTWDNLYQIVTNLDVIIQQSEANESGSLFVYMGIAKVLKAYTFSMMVDIWGDIPYSEFNKFKDGVRQPKYDDDAAIYPQLLTMLDDGIANLKNTAVQGSKPAADDIVYKGSTAKWIKAANTIKLKLLTQMRLVKDVKTQVKALLADPASLINSQDESFLFPFGKNAATDDRYPGYGDYSTAQRGGQVPSHWIWGIMKGYNAGINTGIVDPRIPYYFYRQKKSGDVPENCTDYRDGGFITLIFGSQSPCVGGSNSNTYTLLGLYPIGGRYDDNAGKNIGASSGELNSTNAGTGAAPQRALTYADRLYLEAELIQAGLADGDLAAVFNKAVDASFKQVDYVVTNYIKPEAQVVPLVDTLAATKTYKTSVSTAFAAANNEKKLEHIMTQKWLSRIGNSVDNYTDYRRTKYPVRFDPQPVGAVTTVTVPGGAGGIGAGTVTVSNGTPYPLSLPWSQTEINRNGNAPPQKVASTYKVFWQP